MVMDLFANRVHDVRFVNGIVRIEFCIAGRNEEGEFTADAPVKPDDVRFAVNLPLQGFGRSMGMMREFFQELQKKGVLRKPGEGGEAQGRGDNREQVRKKQASLVDITAGEEGDGGESGQGGQPIV